MRLNKTRYYVHNTLFAIYALFLVLMLLPIFSLGRQQTDWLFIIAILLVILGMAYFHYKAAIEAEKGTETGKLMSSFIGCLFLFGFPIGTCIGILILLNVRKAKWQSGHLAFQEDENELNS